MESLAQADIFFFVTTIVVVVVGIAFLIVLLYLIQFLRDLNEIFHVIREEAVHVIDDIEAFRENIEGKASKLNKLLGILTTTRVLRKLYKQLRRDKSDSDK